MLQLLVELYGHHQQHCYHCSISSNTNPFRESDQVTETSVFEGNVPCRNKTSVYLQRRMYAYLMHMQMVMLRTSVLWDCLSNLRP